MDARDPWLESKPFRSRHARQIGLVRDFSWLDIDALDGIEDEYAVILDCSVPDPSALEHRKRALCAQLRRRIEFLRELAEDA
ncbi:MAG: hypothetical protein FWH47_05690 [Methanomassiliicoccaceae archaeon]|nr:hypothetical protein [Methanomassiliicoccaceae archaeon]